MVFVCFIPFKTWRIAMWLSLTAFNDLVHRSRHNFYASVYKNFDFRHIKSWMWVYKYLPILNTRLRFNKYWILLGKNDAICQRTRWHVLRWGWGFRSGQQTTHVHAALHHGLFLQCTLGIFLAMHVGNMNGSHSCDTTWKIQSSSNFSFLQFSLNISYTVH